MGLRRTRRCGKDPTAPSGEALEAPEALEAAHPAVRSPRLRHRQNSIDPLHAGQKDGQLRKGLAARQPGEGTDRAAIRSPGPTPASYYCLRQRPDAQTALDPWTRPRRFGESRGEAPVTISVEWRVGSLTEQEAGMARSGDLDVAKECSEYQAPRTAARVHVG